MGIENEEIRRISCIVALLAVVTLLAVSCVPFGSDAPQGISLDTRTFKKISDERMIAEAENYKGYIFKDGDSVMTFRLKKPSVIKDDMKYPLIVFLHGSGDGGTDNSRHMYKSLINSVGKYVGDDCYVLMPQADKKLDWTQIGGKSGDKGSSNLYNKMLDAVIGKNSAIDTNRVYLTGMSMGGNGTIYQAYNYPEKYASVIALCGYYNEKIISDLSRFDGMGIWLEHSKTDDVVNYKESEGLYNRLISYGRSTNDTKLNLIEKYKHDITEISYDNQALWQWLMAYNKK